MKTSALKVSIIIVNYNAGDFLLKCLASLEAIKQEIPFDVWVVDNASTDGSFEEAKRHFKDYSYIKNEKNIGFGAANNVVLSQINTPHILLLNPDTEIIPGTLSYMVNYMEEHANVGVASCKVEKEDGSLDWASHRGFPTPWASFLYFGFGNDRLYHLTDQDFLEDHEVDAIAGAFFLIRKEALDQAGIFDEDYFLYAEDIDLCYRIKQSGFKVMYVPYVRVIHHKGVSSGIKSHTKEISQATQQSRIRALNSFYETMIIFYKKHLASQYPFFVNWLVYLGINLKWRIARRSMSV